MKLHPSPPNHRRQRGWLGWSLVWSILAVLGLSVLSAHQLQSLALRQAGQQWAGLQAFEVAEAALALTQTQIEQHGLRLAACAESSPSVSPGQTGHWICQMEASGVTCLCATDATAPLGSTAAREVRQPVARVQAMVESSTRLRLLAWGCSRSGGICDPTHALPSGQARASLSVWLTRPGSEDLGAVTISSEAAPMDIARWSFEPGSWSER